MSRVLVVDDEEGIRRLVSTVLGLEGYSVETSRNGAEALAAVEADAPSLVVLDMRMPVLDGWRFAEEMERRGHDIPILVMTAAQDARAWAEQIHAEGYVSKPFRLEELLEQTAELIGPP